MPTPKKGPRLGGSPAHQRLILSNLATQLFEHGKITTTESRARTLRPLAEKLITKAKVGDLHNRREVLKTVRDKGVVHVLFTEIAPLMAERPGGYTRITKIGPRKGDNAPMAVIELITSETVSSEADRARRVASSKPATKKADSTEKADKPAKDADDSKAQQAADRAEDAADISLEAAVEVDEEAPGTEAAEKSLEAAEAAEQAADAAEEAADASEKKDGS